MTTNHADWSKTLEWVEKNAQESMKARFTTAEILAKEAQTTLTVLLAGIGGTAVYASKLLEQAVAKPLEVGAALACVYFVVLAVVLVVTCMVFRSYPALYQDPENLMHPTYSLDDIRQEEIKNLGMRIKEAAKINSHRAKRLNQIRIAIAISPLLFAVVVAITPTKAVVATKEIKQVCDAQKTASGALAKNDCVLTK
jgi:hypothetical protein